MENSYNKNLIVISMFGFVVVCMHTCVYMHVSTHVYFTVWWAEGHTSQESPLRIPVLSSQFLWMTQVINAHSESTWLRLHHLTWLLTSWDPGRGCKQFLSHLQRQCPLPCLGHWRQLSASRRGEPDFTSWDRVVGGNGREDLLKTPV